MARNNRQDLFLNIRGDVTDLRTATVAGKTVLNDFSGTAVNVLEEVEKKFREVGASGLPNIRKTEQAFVESFKRIRDVARAGADAGPASAVEIIDANAARQQAEAATIRAAALREVAQAASLANVAENGNNAATYAYSVAASTAALEAEQMAKGLRDQALVLTGVERQLESTGRAHGKAIVISAQARVGYQQLSYQLGDISTMYAMGASSSQIFASQSSQVIQALQLIGGEGNKLLTFLGGPWGIALSSAAVAIIPFATKMLESGNAIAGETKRLGENADRTAVAEQAKIAFARTEKGLIDDVRQLTAEIEKQNDALNSNAERLNIRAKQDLAGLQKQRDDLTRQLQAARAESQSANAAPTTLDGGDRTRRVVAADRVNNLETRLKAIDTAITSAQKALLSTQTDLAAEAATRAIDPLEQIKRRYNGPDGLIEQAKKRALAEGTVTTELTRQITALKQREKDEIAAEQARRSASRNTGSDRQFGREVNVAEATRIVGSIGGRVTSGIRSTERQAELYAAKQAGRHNGPVARPGTSAHEAGGAYDAIDVAYGSGISVKSIREAFAKEGVRLRKILNEPGQRVFHVEFARAGAGDDRAAERQQRNEEAQERKRVQDADAYASLLDQVQGRRLDLERSRTLTIEQAAALDVQGVAMAREDVVRSAQKGVELGRWTQAQADGVKIMATVNAVNEQMAIRQREAQAVVNRQFDIDQAALADRVELFRLDGELATTAAERRRIARQLLDIEQQQVEAALRNRISNEADPLRRASLESQLVNVGSEYDRRRQILDRQNDDPLQRYGRDLIEGASDMDEAFKQVKADGLRSLEDGLVGVISGTESVAGAFRRMADDIIADLARIAIRKMIVQSLGSSFFGLADGGRVADVPGFADGGMPYVDNGLIRGPGDGRSDSILALVGGRKPIRISNGEAIVNERGVRNHWPLIKAINDDRLPKFADGGLVGPAAMNPRMPSLEAARRDMAGGRRERLEADVRVSVNPGPEFDARVESVSTRTVAAASEPIMAAAHDRTMRALQRPSLPGSY